MYELWTKRDHAPCALCMSKHKTPLAAIRALHKLRRRLGLEVDIWVAQVRQDADGPVRVRLDLATLQQQHRERKALQS